eukprot:10027714-Lingulodinium_polyedra.AAC.1
MLRSTLNAILRAMLRVARTLQKQCLDLRNKNNAHSNAGSIIKSNATSHASINTSSNTPSKTSSNTS